MAGRGAKRKLKKLQRSSEEATAIVGQCIQILSLHGYTISLPYEIPQVLQQILAGQGVPAPSGGAAHPASSKETALARLEMDVDSGFDQGPAFTAEPAQPVEQDLDDMDFSNTDFGASPSVGAQGSHQVGDGQIPPISTNEMAQRVEDANARMMDRVAAHGVRHKGGQGPADMQGRRMQAADGSAGSADSMMGDDSEQPAPTGGGGKRNYATGLTRDESAAIIARVTGKGMDPPGSSPVAKPR